MGCSAKMLAPFAFPPCDDGSGQAGQRPNPGKSQGEVTWHVLSIIWVAERNMPAPFAFPHAGLEVTTVGGQSATQPTEQSRVSTPDTCFEDYMG